MNVRKIFAKEFMHYAEVAVDLPGRGVVLVTGPNGSGKSSLVECVSYAGWGETLRGTSPWPKGAKGQLHVVTESEESTCGGLSLARAVKGGKNTLRWDCGESIDAPEFPNNTKAQEALERIIGPHDVWKRSHVFSSQDAAHFTLATDSERKRLLESLLGLAIFDDALARCRVDRKKAEESYQAVFMRTSVLSERAEGEKRRLADAKLALQAAPAPEDEALKAKAAELARLISSTADEQKRTAEAISALERSCGAHDTTLRMLDARVQRVKGSQCDACGQPVDRAYRDKVAAEAADERRAAEDLRLSAVAKRTSLIETANELSSYRGKLVDKLASVRATLATADRARAEHTRLAKLVAEVEASLASAEKEKATNAEEEARRATVLHELEACEQVLGMKGVRAHMLGRALVALEAAANAWLARIAGPGVTVSLRSHVEKKSGGISDAIGLEVVGVGGGLGYRAASGGERRRIDVALLLGMASIAEASAGAAPGTLFFDEVFDSLDQQGVTSVWAILNEISADRAVVVISHNEAIWGQAASAALHLHVEDGRVSHGG